MLTSIAFILIFGLLLGYLFKLARIPGLVGMILTGVLLGPHVLNLIDESILTLSPDLRQIALVIILTRAGLTLDIRDLKRVGRSALMMSFVPATFEMVAITLLGPLLLGMDTISSMVMGAVLAAVSPAVVVPFMLKIMKEGYGVKHSVPQLVLSGASVDDVYVIVAFTSFTALSLSGTISAASFIGIPISIILGVLLGIMGGLALITFFRHFHMRDSMKVLLFLSVSFLLLEIEQQLAGIVSVSGLLAIMAMGITMNQKYPELAIRLSDKFDKLWIPAEVFLFVLVGTSLDISYALQAGFATVALVVFALVIRMLGVYLSTAGTILTTKEKIFTMGAYTPKATVQAAIGGVPLAMGLPFGKEILTVSIIAILITAPLGAFFIENSYKKLLVKD